LRNPHEVPAPRPELRRSDSNARPVPDLILLVQHVDGVESSRESLQPLAVEVVAHAQIDLSVVGQSIPVRDIRAVRPSQIPAKPRSEQQISADARTLPLVRSAAGGGYLLLVIQVDVVSGDVREVSGCEIELSRHNVLADRALDRCVRIRLKMPRLIV